MSVELFRLVIIIGICAIGIAIVAFDIGKSKGYSEGYDRGYSLTLFTAEQAEEVKDIVDRNWHNLADEYGMGPQWSSANPEDDYDWHAIAHELNVMKRGTCQDLGGTGANDEQVFNCSECGCVLSLYDRDGSNNLCTSFISDHPRYCPECGRKVVGE